MAAQRRRSGRNGASSERAFAADGASTRVPDDGLDAARGVGWGLLLTLIGFWAPMLLLWRWLHR